MIWPEASPSRRNSAISAPGSSAFISDVPDQHRIGAGRCHAACVGAGKDAAFGDLDGCRRYLRQEFLGNSQIDAKVGQVAVIDPNDRCPGIERDAQFGRVMDLDQRVQSGLGGMAEKVRQRRAERGDDQQHRIGPGGAGFDNLVRIDDEILAQHRRGLRVPARYPDPPAHRRNDPAR